MTSSFTPFHRGGSRTPLVCLHGFTDTWRTWQLVLERLERRHGVLALTLPGHTGGPPLPAEASAAGMADAVERLLDDTRIRAARMPTLAMVIDSESETVAGATGG